MGGFQFPVVGVGVDIVEVDRIGKLIEKFGIGKLRFLTPRERARIRRPEQVAGVFAAKEAVGKALGVGIGGRLSFQEVEIGWTSAGKPYLVEGDLWRKWGIVGADLSISHDGGVAVAVVVLFRRPGGLPEEEEGYPGGD
jgi:holo-[acyl-carrier protein] synthase